MLSMDALAAFMPTTTADTHAFMPTIADKHPRTNSGMVYTHTYGHPHTDTHKTHTHTRLDIHLANDHRPSAGMEVDTCMYRYTHVSMHNLYKKANT